MLDAPTFQGSHYAMRHIPNWTSLDAAARQNWRSSARERASALSTELNAFVEIEPAKTRLGRTLDGLPYAAKDMLRTPSHRPSGGLAEAGDLGIVGNSDLLDRLDEAGADRIGFTQMTELAYEPSGFNASRGRVKNPWSLDRVSGGSSSGSAAAVASGAVAVALGSDTGGSLRIPAHCCGITAWKPTYGRISTRGAMPLAPSLDTIGVLARSAADLLPLVAILADLPASHPIRGIVVLDDVAALCAPDIAKACTSLAAVLSGLGTGIERREALPAIEAIDAHALTIMFAESARVHRACIEDPAIAPVLRRRLAKGLEVADDTFAASIAARPRLIADFEEQVLAGADAAMLPVMAIATPTAAECDPASDRFSPKTLYAMSRFTRFVNLLGFPAVALPAGFDERGLPVAMQIVGRPGSDRALLDLVRDIQRKTQWHSRAPTAVAHLLLQLETAL
jgi:aspartyl-tRNA(Asn)/glutamyl-tRNA(Gln) amidotransferase subunit A